MFFLVQHLSAWVAAALALGLGCGLLACRGREKPRWGFLGFVLTLVLGLAAADALGPAEGRLGLWLETGLMVLACYLVGSGAGCVLGLIFAPRVKPAPPDWMGAAREARELAEAFVAAAPAAIAASEAAAARLASPAAKPAPASAPKPSEALPQPEPPPSSAIIAEIPPPAADELAAVHGLDRRFAQGLRGEGVGDLASLATLEPEGRKAAAARLGVEQEVVDYWAAQALLLAHGIAPPVPGPEKTDAGLDAGSARALIAGLPQIIAAQANDALYPGERPLGALAAPAGAGDDLTRIAGIDDAAMRRLHALGIWTYAQIAAWTADNARWIDFYFAEPGRIGREDWREQARMLASRAPVAL